MGGPGFGCAPPQTMGFTKLAFDRGYQMLYIDQRGTGLSSPITKDTLALQGDVQQQAEYLKLFRADSIVRDCEAIRKTLTQDSPKEVMKWSLLGQSFGGFCAFTYLSFHPEGLREVFTTGGIPPIGRTAEQVYQATYAHVIKRNEFYYTKYPEDVHTVRQIALHISENERLGLPIMLPSGGKLGIPRLMAVGIKFGSGGGIDRVHELITRMATDLQNFSFLTRPTLAVLDDIGSFDDAIIYALLHEPIYQELSASNWAAYRVGHELEHFEWLRHDFDVTASSAPMYFSGEMVYPSSFHSSSELSPLKEVADILAASTDWPQLYDAKRLANNDVPIFSATYTEDMYVDFGLAQEVAARTRGIKTYITSTMFHGALRENTEEVMEQLFKLRDDTMS